MAKPLPTESHEDVDRLLAPSTREEQISYAVREALSRQAQHDAKAVATEADPKTDSRTSRTSRTDSSVAPLADGSHHITLSNIYKNGKEISFADDLDAHIGKFSEPSNVLSQRLIFEHSRDRAFDHLADSIFPGFGRLEFSFLKRDMRVDYLNGHRCTSQKLGICFSTTGR